jgi:hypothetical protein
MIIKLYHKNKYIIVNNYYDLLRLKYNYKFYKKTTIEDLKYKIKFFSTI